MTVDPSAMPPVSKWVRATPIAAAFLVGAASFTLSFFAQSEVSAQLGAVPAHLSWLVPIVIDGGILAGSASIWSSSTRGARKDPIAYLTVVALLALSVVINVQHAAEGQEILSAVIAGAPPVVLLLCLELVASQARRAAREQVAEPANPPEEHQTPLAPAAAAPALPLSTPQAPAAHTPHALEPDARQGWSYNATQTSPLASAQPSPTPHPTTSALAPEAATTDAPKPDALAAPESVPAPEPEPSAARETPGAAAPDVTPPSLARATSAPRTPAKGSVAALVRQEFTRHIDAGGDPNDTTLARTIATKLDAPVASVRRTLGEARKALAAD